MNDKITTEQVKELRDKTGISVMQCRKALSEAGGDMDKAIAVLKKTSADIALKKADRVAKDGRVAVKSGAGKSVLVSLHCETDFVSKNEDFVNLLDRLSDIALSLGVAGMQEKAKDMIDPIIQKTGEKIELGGSFEIEGGVIGSYVHNNKSAVVVSLEGGSAQLAKDVAMHIAAMKPEFLSAEEITEESRKTVAELFQKDVAQTDKPEEIRKKMLEGKISSYFKERTLSDQNFIKNPEETVGVLLSKNKAKIRGVKRYSI